MGAIRARYVWVLWPTVLSFLVPGPPIPTIPGTIRDTSGENVFPTDGGGVFGEMDTVCDACDVVTMSHVFNADLPASKPKLSTFGEYDHRPPSFRLSKAVTDGGADAPVPPDR